MSIEYVEQHWQVFAFVVGLIVWFVRLEGKTLNNEERISHVEHQVENIESGLSKELAEVKQTLARIEGYLKGKSEKANE